jgi:hypothetical protein
MVFNNNLLLGAAGAAGGYTIDQSIRFNDNDSAYLTRTPGSAGNRRTWTWSAWVKLGNLTIDRSLFSANADGCELRYAYGGSGADNLRFYNYSGSYTNDAHTSALYRDPSSWYHVVLAVDTTQATASNRIKIYVNGVDQILVDGLGAQVAPAQNTELGVNTTSAHYIGRFSNGASRYMDGYMAEINFIDGTALDPSSFGEVNSDTGQWVPIAYTGSYGTNGFYITGEDSADLGADDSGNGNDFTSSGLTTADQMLDTPTDNYATFNVIRTGQTGITLTDGALQASAGAAGTRAVAADIPIDSETTTGYYAEIKITALAFASPSFFGLVTPEFVIGATAMYLSSGAYVYNDSAGATYANGVAGATYTAIVLNDVVQFAVKNGNVYVGINNTWVNSGDPVAETGAVWTGLSGLYSFCWEYSRGGAGTNTHTVVADFGQSGFAYTPPTGYSGVSTATLPDPTIADPSAHFQATAYAGSASALEVNQSGNSTFQPDFIWIKQRTDAGTNHQLVDAVRGENLRLESDNTDAEGDVGAGGITSFDADGFSVGTNSNYNAASKNFIAWQWKADNTSGSSNTDGSITSSVSANTTSGFSIGTYTGTGGNDTVGHGLGVAPALVIIKERTGTYNGGWYTYHKSTGATGYLRLQTTTAFTADSTFMNDTAPTSSVFSLGTNLGPNGTTTYVFYAFAEVDGFSKFGSYVGNASADGPFIDCGFRPAFVMYKRTDSADYWIIKDDVRSNYNPNNLRIFPSQSAAEDTSVNGAIDIVSNGFKVRSDDTIVNASGGTYIYAAFARSPFKTANAR